MDEERAEELAGLHELALRLLPLFGHDVSADRRPELLVGQLPANLPIPLPLPRTLISSAASMGERRTDIFFDTNEPLEELQRLYAEQHGRHRVAEHERLRPGGPGRGGFVSHPTDGARRGNTSGGSVGDPSSA